MNGHPIGGSEELEQLLNEAEAAWAGRCGK
jgi:hypothetical protein